jgi:uncharacterized sodium:solute symporter family permease YidK
MNGLVKVPMQFLILLIGALVFTFYQFNKAPIFFNHSQIAKIESSPLKDSFYLARNAFDTLSGQKQKAVIAFSEALHSGDKQQEVSTTKELLLLQKRSDSLRNKVKGWIGSKQVGGDGNDTNYIFLRFVMDYLPRGLIGLLIAIIFLASWGSIAAAINSLASCSMVDFHKRFTRKKETGEDQYYLSKWYTLAWGIFCIVVAMFTYNVGNSLIEAVNVLGSLFYGVILGVFLVAFFFKNIKSGSAVFWAALLGESIVLLVFILAKYKVISLGFLWLNPIGAFAVIGFALLLNQFFNRKLKVV